MLLTGSTFDDVLVEIMVPTLDRHQRPLDSDNGEVSLTLKKKGARPRHVSMRREAALALFRAATAALEAGGGLGGEG